MSEDMSQEMSVVRTTICPCCQQQVSSKFCGECGTKQTQPSSDNYPTPKPSQPVQVSDSSTPPTVNDETERVSQERSTPKNSTVTSSSHTHSGDPSCDQTPTNDGGPSTTRPTYSTVVQLQPQPQIKKGASTDKQPAQQIVPSTDSPTVGPNAGQSSGNGQPSSAKYTISNKAHEPSVQRQNSTENSFQVTFHLLVPTEAWNWIDLCHVSIRYGYDNTSQPWSEVPLTEQHRECNSRFQTIEINAVAKFPLHFLNEKHPYRYVVKHPDYNPWFESFYDFASGGTRCLEFDDQASSDIRPKKLHHVYDGFIFPTETWPGWFLHLIKTQRINTKNAWGFAMNIFLQRLRLTQKETEDYDIANLYEAVYGIYCHIRHKRFAAKGKFVVFPEVEQLRSGIQKWILSTIDYLSNHRNVTADHTRVWIAKVIMALVTIMRKTEVLIPSDSNALKIMLSSLSLEKSLCTDVVIKMEGSLRKEVVLSIARLCSMSMAITKTPILEWLATVPLLHQLQSSDGAVHDIDPENPDWGISALDQDKLNEFGKYVQNKKMISKLFTEVKCHLEDDPLLLRLLVYLSSEDDVDVVLSHAPAHYFAIHVSQICHKNNEKLTRDARKKLCNVVTKLHEKLDLNAKRLHCMMIAVKRILDKLVNVCGTAPDDIAVICLTVELYLCALSGFYNSAEKPSGDSAKQRVTDVLIFLILWLQRPEVGLGETFGGENANKIKDELKVWSEFLKTVHSEHLIPCIQQEWQLQMQQTIKSRVDHDKMDVSAKIALALEVCDSKVHCDPVISEIIWNSVAEVMEDGAALRKALSDSKKTSIGALLNILLTKYYATKDMNLSTLFSFPLWPEYLQHYRDNDELAHEYTDESVKKCKDASKIIKDVFEKLEQNKVTVHDLKVLTSHKEKAMKLFPPEVQANNKSIEELINKRNAEVLQFQKYCFKVKILLQYCGEIAKGYLKDGLEDGLRTVNSEEEYPKLITCQLCDVIHDMEVYSILDIADKDVLNMLEPFSIMMHDNKTDIFTALWKHHVDEQVKTSTKLSLSEIATKVWAPCLEVVQQVVNAFHDRSVTLQDIDCYLKDISSENLESEIYTLVTGCNKCFQPVAPITWVPQFVVSVKEYRGICEVKEAAEVVLKAKDALRLIGNFQQLEDLKEKISDNMMFSLEIFETAYCYEEVKCLTVVAENHVNKEFLSVLSKCQDFIEWLQQETNDVTELQTFIGLSAFEEDAAAMDRIAQLHTVGSAISPVVYKYKENRNVDFDEFLKACQPIWELLEVTPKLSESLESCHINLNFFKQIRELQMPIEIGTYGQIKAILEDGEYHIGSKKHMIFHGIDEMVSLKPTKDSKRLNQTYTLNDLKELESKIVLIRDHSSFSVGKDDHTMEITEISNYISSSITDNSKLSSKDIEKFLNVLHHIVHIADALLRLQMAGNPQYIQWFKLFACHTINETELEALNSKMRKDLKKWLETMFELRNALYALNYYTCLQLLKISKEFYQVINKFEHQISNEVLLLLKSISPDLTLNDIKEVMSSVKAQSFSSKSSNALSASFQDKSVCSIDEIDEEVKKLTTEEYDIYMSVKDVDYDSHLVLKALHECGPDEDLVLGWCIENGHIFDGNDISENSIAIPEESKIDANNSTVKELIELEFSLKLAIEAVKECGEDVCKCQYYCTSQLRDRSVDVEENSCSATPDSDASLPLLSSSDSADDSAQEVDEESNYLDFKSTALLLDDLTKNPCDVFKAVISLYVADITLPLPSLDEVLICNHKTTVEEINLLWYRAVKDPDFKRIFCLVGAEKLPYQVCTEALSAMDEVLKGNTDYRLVILCSNENKDEKSFIMEHLRLYHRNISAVITTDDKIQRYLQHHFLSENVSHQDLSCASVVDPAKCSVRVITSDYGGMGKSLCVTKLEKKLQQKLTEPTDYPLCITIPIHGPGVDLDVVMKYLQHHLIHVVDPPPQIFHFDIPPSVLDDVDALLFSILVLKGFSDSSGKVWRCFPQQLYLIETTFTSVKQSGTFDGPKNSNTLQFLKFIPTITCCSPKQALSSKTKNVEEIYEDEVEILSDHYQRPYQYLIKLKSPPSKLDKYSYSSKKKADGESVLSVALEHFAHNGVENPSWMELRNFMHFLNVQLADCETSVFCKGSYTMDTLPGFKKFVIKFMLKMAKDFAVPSLNIALKNTPKDNFDTKAEMTSKIFGDAALFSTSTPTKTSFTSHEHSDYLPHTDSGSSLIAHTESLTSVESSSDEDNSHLTTKIEQLQFHSSRVWDGNFHPYIFFNHDRNSMTFIGFCANKGGDLIDPVSKKVLYSQIIDSKLMQGLSAQQVTFRDDGPIGQKELLRRLCMVIGVDDEECKRFDRSYVLTADNTKKILAILMRFRCNIPVILMGETGCGKTRLIKYMCDLLSLKSPGCKTLVIMKVHGGVSEENIVKEVKEARKLAKKNAKDGLETVMFFDEANTTEAIGLIKEVMCDKRIRGEPIEENIKFIAACNPYRRHSREMINKLERAGLGYYVQSVNTKQKLGSVPLRHLVYRVLDLPSSMQSLVYDFGQLNSETERDYTNKIVEKYSSRIEPLDVNRVTEVLMACQTFMRNKKGECSFVSLRDIERAMIVMDWFHKFLPQIEKDYPPSDTSCDTEERALILSIAVCYYTKLRNREDFEKMISGKLNTECTLFTDHIKRCQEVFLKNMKLPPNIAWNNALRENVFMMVVCIELKIPLFLVGKPGSSKSLAKSIVVDSMQGAASSSPLFRKLKQVQLFSYQCSQHSTSKTILEVFNNATRFQEKKKGQNCVSVVVLDEVGLAEDSPSLPLKTLHPLLEDGTTTGSNNVADRVAFIGISNWALDPAKMNRGIMVTRNDPGVEELVLSAKGICHSSSDNQVCERLKDLFEPFAEAYLEVCKEQAKAKKEFFGLRDFYSLIKMTYWISQKTGKCLTLNQLQHCLKRNFSGRLDTDKTIQIFRRNILSDVLESELTASDFEEYPCTSIGLIKTSLQSKAYSAYGETRYLLFLTENYDALRILQQRDLIDHDPLILFGSSFPEDSNYTQVCRNINQIKFCMDTGRTVILLNLEHLYESLYDVLNQYYMTLSNRRYVDLGLQSHRIKCRVHQNFRLILIADKDKVYDEFPTPLINRLEKHYLVASTVLTNEEKTVMEKIDSWVKEFIKVSTDKTVKFKPGDCFVGYQPDTPASIVFKVCQVVDHDKFSDNDWEKQALSKSKEYLLRIATPDSVVRCKSSKQLTDWKEVSEIYFRMHSYAYLNGLLNKCLSHASDKGMCIQITTHGTLLQHKNLISLQESTGYRKDQVSFIPLQQFTTEMQFCSKIRLVFQREIADDHLIIIQCDSGHKHSDLIACARYRVLDEKAQAAHLNNTTHVVFIIGLPRRNGGTKFVSFQGGKWESYHVDSLVPAKDSLFTIEEALKMTKNDLLLCCYNHDRELFYKRLQQCISPSFLLKSNNQLVEKAMERFSVLSQLLKKTQLPTNHQSLLDDSTATDQHIFCQALLQHVINYLKAKTNIQPRFYAQDWAIREALDANALYRSGSYINALSVKVDHAIADAVNHLIDSVDRYSNLQLLLTENSTIKTLWLKIFGDTDIVDINIRIEPAESNSNSAVFAAFNCQFPFFWLFVNSIESQWKIPPHSGSLDIYKRLQSKPFAENLLAIGDTNEVIFKGYIHDFVMLSCGMSPENDNTKMFEEMVYHEHAKILAKDQLHDISNMLLYKIIILHEAHHRIESQQQRLRQIISLKSELSWTTKLLPYFDEEMNIDIDLFAIQEVLTFLKPDFKNWSPEDCSKWLHEINNYQNIVDATINAAVNTHDPSPTCVQIRKDWQLLRVLQIFVEHTFEYDSAVTRRHAMRMHKFLEKDHDFSKLAPYDKLKMTIDAYSKDKDISRSNRDRAKNSCRVLFLEIVSEVIFAVSSSSSAINDPPEDELIIKLIETVIPNTGSTQQLSPLKDNIVDETPVVRSNLLQMLLDYNMDKIKPHLDKYFTDSRDIVQMDMDFCVLCVQCFEDSLHKKSNGGTFFNTVHLALEQIESDKQHIFSENVNVMTLHYVECVARLRYALVIVARISHVYLDLEKFSLLSKDEIQIARQLLISVQKMYLTIEVSSNKETQLVADFLLKTIIRKYGMSTFMTLCNKDSSNADLSWIMPKHLLQNKSEMKVDAIIDQFVIYGNAYSNVRDSLAISQEENVITTYQKLEHADNDNVPILLALFSTVTMSHLSDPKASGLEHFTPEVLSSLKEYTCSSVFTDSDLIAQMASQLIDNFYSSLLPVRPLRGVFDHQLCAIVVHTAAVLACSNSLLLSPLKHFANPSRALLNVYFPTMPHDELFETSEVFSSENAGEMYECENGHPFVITECGRPWEKTTCHECGVPIGGERHKLVLGNTKYKKEDTTQTGHLLGPAHRLSKQATPERDLSPVVCTITRLIMHAALTWSSLCVTNSLEVLRDVVHTAMEREEMPQFFWDHLTRDLSVLSRILEISTDDATLIVHLILKEMNDKPCSGSSFDLLSKECRKDWEKQFSESYIHRLRTDMPFKLKAAQDLIVSDNRQAHLRLLEIAYEKNTDENPVAAMWRYRSQITIEHLQLFMDQPKYETQCPILKEFLNQGLKLRATQYLPDIIQLQQILYKKFNYIVDEDEVSHLTVEVLLSEGENSTLIKMVESFQKAWQLVKLFLPNHGRKRVPKDLIMKMPNKPQSIPLVYLIPTTTGKGICSTALVDFLVTTHNDFIEFYHSTNKIKALSPQTLPLKDLQKCYLVADEQQFMSIVLSHCHYSLTRGKGTEVEYDIPALERHFLNRFVHGRPLFDLSTACVVLQRKNLHNSENFAAIRRNISQKTISPEVKGTIINELRDSNKLNEVLEIVNTILTIIANQTAKDKSERTIGEFADQILNQKVVSKVKNCSLNNLISIWETLAVEQARRAILDDQDPFKDISDHFKQPLCLPPKEDKAFHASLKKFRADELLGSLYQFIVIGIRSFPVDSRDWLLRDAFPTFLEKEELDVPGLGDKIKTSMHKSIALSHIVNTFTTIVKNER